jgi:hypothetical protein
LFAETVACPKVVLHDVETSVVQEDIHRYIRHGLTEILKRLGLRMSPDWITDEKMYLLIKKAGRSFALAAVALRFIADDRVLDPPRLLRMILDPQTAQEAGATYWISDQLYQRILHNLPDPCQGVILERFQVIVWSIVVLIGGMRQISFTVPCIVFVQPLSRHSVFTRHPGPMIGRLWTSSSMLRGAPWTASLFSSQNRNNALPFVAFT